MTLEQLDLWSRIFLVIGLVVIGGFVLLGLHELAKRDAAAIRFSLEKAVCGPGKLEPITARFKVPQIWIDDAVADAIREDENPYGSVDNLIRDLGPARPGGAGEYTSINDRRLQRGIPPVAEGFDVDLFIAEFNRRHPREKSGP